MPRLHGAALAEIRSAASWYEERVPGLGASLLSEVEATFAKIDPFPEAGTPWRFPGIARDIRRAAVRTFPYGVYYLPEPTPRVLAFAHSAREPSYWVERLGDAD